MFGHQQKFFIAICQQKFITADNYNTAVLRIGTVACTSHLPVKFYERQNVCNTLDNFLLLSIRFDCMHMSDMLATMEGLFAVAQLCQREKSYQRRKLHLPKNTQTQTSDCHVYPGLSPFSSPFKKDKSGQGLSPACQS